MKARVGIRALAVALIAGVFASVAPAAYHFIHYNTRTAPFRPIPEKFDVNSLPGKTLNYYVTDQFGVQLAPGDTYIGMMSQIRAAADVWNDVPTSDLRLAFGGLAAPRSPQSAPILEILFEDLPPGVIATGTPTVRAENNGQFVPILRSLVIVRTDLRDKPSFGESLFGTLVHEIGHGLGLQHSFTSGVMSTTATRTTSRSKPLTTDDVAAISSLYPSQSFAESTASISGRVTMTGSNGVNLASVVAIAPSGAAVSTLTNPDGTYRISGAPAGNYFLYVHPLPPPRPGQTVPGDVIQPLDVDGKPIPPSAPFFTTFYPGTNDVSRAISISVAPGQSFDNANFTVTRRNGYGIHSVDTRAFNADFAVKPPYLSPNIRYPFLVASGVGLIANEQPVAGLSVRVLGGAASNVRPYSPAPGSYLQIDFDVRTLSFSNDSARHLVFSANNDIYVLPAAFFHVEKLPPSISSVIPMVDSSGQRLALISGTNLGENSRVYFDGAPGTIRDFDALSGRLTVSPPPASSSHRAAVVVLNPDGQSSLFLQGDNPSTYTYLATDAAIALAASAPSVTMNPGVLPAGSEAMVQIDVAGAQLAEGQSVIGFGNSDIVVRNLTVTSPTRMLANIAVSATSQTGPSTLTVVSGLQMITNGFGLQVIPPNRSFWISSNIAPAVAGSSASLSLVNAPALPTAANTVVTLNDRAVPIQAINGTQITFQVPPGTVPGPATLRVDVNGERSLPILFTIEAAPPRIVFAGVGSNENTRTLKIGQFAALSVLDLQPNGTVAVDRSNVTVKIGNVDAAVTQVAGQAVGHRVLIFVPDGTLPARDLPLTLSANGRTSEPFTVSLE
jgi:uncharacterized protein (TIGR03437 family)